MRRLAFLSLLIATSLAGCDFDNYEPPKSVLEGRLVYDGQPVHVRENAIQLELWQDGYALHTAIPVYVKQDGSFQATLFDGDYKLVRKQNVGPWVSDPDTVLVELRGGQTLDVPVQPFFVVEDAQVTRELLKVRPGFTVEQLVEDRSGYSDNPTFRREFARIVEGARKAGLPER